MNEIYWNVKYLKIAILKLASHIIAATSPQYIRIRTVLHVDKILQFQKEKCSDGNIHLKFVQTILIVINVRTTNIFRHHLIKNIGIKISCYQLIIECIRLVKTLSSC